LRRLLSMATIVTPNIPEAEILLGETFRGDMEHFAKRLMKIGASAVLLKGGHYGGKHSNDLYMDAKQSRLLEADRIKTNNNHGTGCTLAAALAVYLAKGLPAPEAAYAAKKVVTEALKHADELSVGSGRGPVHHFYAQWK
jgi:hydroxymethylpyrimidine/phosphomethylpyrimidine kinase